MDELLREVALLKDRIYDLELRHARHKHLGDVDQTQKLSAGAAAGNNTEIQFNDNGVLAGDGNFVWDKTLHFLTIGSPAYGESTFNTSNGGTSALVGMDGDGVDGGQANIYSGNALSANNNGGNSFFTAGNGHGSGSGGWITAQAGGGGATGVGGIVQIAAGDGGASGNGTGGSAVMNAGNGTGTASGGIASIIGGNANGGNAGKASVIGGNATSGSKNGGNVFLTAGTGSGTGHAGDVIAGGDSVGGALSTATTGRYLVIPRCNGVPTGTPTFDGSMIYDYANNNLYVYNGGWKKVLLA